MNTWFFSSLSPVKAIVSLQVCLPPILPHYCISMRLPQGSLLSLPCRVVSHPSLPRTEGVPRCGTLSFKIRTVLDKPRWVGYPTSPASNLSGTTEILRYTYHINQCNLALPSRYRHLHHILPIWHTNTHTPCVSNTPRFSSTDVSCSFPAPFLSLPQQFFLLVMSIPLLISSGNSFRF